MKLKKNLKKINFVEFINKEINLIKIYQSGVIKFINNWLYDLSKRWR